MLRGRVLLNHTDLVCVCVCACALQAAEKEKILNTIAPTEGSHKVAPKKTTYGNFGGW